MNTRDDEGPFRDPLLDQSIEDTEISAESSGSNHTLVLDRAVSLTLGTESLIVLDDNHRHPREFNCCPVFTSQTKSTRSIPFYNVLWAELSDFHLTINYAHRTAKETVKPNFLSFELEKNKRVEASSWISQLLNRAYNQSKRRKRLKVLINPFGGKGSASRLYGRDIEPLLAAAECTIDLEITQYKGHAMEIAHALDLEAFDAIVCCSGDGIPHEVFNGLGKRPDGRRALAKVAVVQLPCGSGNAMSVNCHGTSSPSLGALCMIKGVPMALDLVSVTQGDQRLLSFLSQTLGVIADADIGTEHLRWLGDARFVFGALVKVLGKTVYPCDVAVKVVIPEKDAIREYYRNQVDETSTTLNRSQSMLPQSDQQSVGLNDMALPPLKYGSITDPLPEGWELLNYDNLGNFYAGNMPFMAADLNFFPAALPNDGYLDLLCIDGDIPRISALKCFTAVENNTLFDLPYVSYRKISAYRIIPKQREGFISIDGESVPFEPFQVEVHKGLGKTLSKTGRVFEGPGLAL